MSNSTSKTGRWIAAILLMLLLLVMVLILMRDDFAKGEKRQVEGYTPWSKETLQIAQTIPIQNGGRIKPLSSYAGFTMLSLHGARKMKIKDSKGAVIEILPTDWLLDSLFRPQLAVKLPTFRINNSSVLEAIGVKPRGKLDRYSYADIEGGRSKLIELAQSYEKIASDKRDPVQSQTVDLAYNLRNYETLLTYFSFARYGITLGAHGGDKKSPSQQASLSTVMMTAPQIRDQIAQSQAQGGTISPHLKALLEQILDSANFAKFALFIFPPEDAKDQTWLTAGNAIMNTMGDTKDESQLAIADVKALETTVALISNEAKFRDQLTLVRDDLVKRANARGEYKYGLLEARYYRKNLFLYALAFFILGTITALVMWTVGQSRAGKIFWWVTVGATVAGALSCIVAIIIRCIIMQRPPVGNLYDTIIFIATTTVLIALLIEWMTKRRFALGIAPMLGTLLIILARRFEIGDGKDNMDPLIAVLDSNYWLTTHVLTITLGYSAGLLVFFVSTVYLLMRGLRLDDGDRETRQAITKAVYGLVCLTLFLSLVGTVLGGIWANDSWGRFWGWDPKENGALMIVLWTLAILHARLGGYIKEWGLHLSSVFTGAIVVFSWWHVNFLGVGLHNYGFTAGKGTIWLFYAITLGILVFGVIAMAMEDKSKARVIED